MTGKPPTPHQVARMLAYDAGNGARYTITRDGETVAVQLIDRGPVRGNARWRVIGTRRAVTYGLGRSKTAALKAVAADGWTFRRQVRFGLKHLPADQPTMPDICDVLTVASGPHAGKTVRVTNRRLAGGHRLIIGEVLADE